MISAVAARLQDTQTNDGRICGYVRQPQDDHRVERVCICLCEEVKKRSVVEWREAEEETKGKGKSTTRPRHETKVGRERGREGEGKITRDV